MEERSGLKDKLLRLIPVYGAYKVEEDLREWDRSIRDEAILHLSKSEESLLTMLEKAVETRARNSISQIEKSRRDIHAVKEKVRTSTYGYFPRLSPIKIKEQALKEALSLDEKIVATAKSLSDKVDVLSNKFEGAEKEVLMDLQELKSDIKSIRELHLKRKMLLSKGHLKGET